MSLTRDKSLVLSTALLFIASCGGGSPFDDGTGAGGSGAKGAPFFLPTGPELHNTMNPTIETDAAGDLHLVYPAYGGGAAYYATCGADCSSADAVKVVAFEADGSVENIMLALGAGGRPQVLFSSHLAVYYGTCTGDCTERSSWRVTEILRHAPNAEREVTGEAFAITAGGAPRFVMHSYRALFDFGAPPPESFYVACDEDCHSPASWSVTKIADQVWQESTLRIGKDGTARLATVATVKDENGSRDLGAYIECSSDCSRSESWVGTGLMPAYSNRNVERIDPAISLALTSGGAPRIAMLGLNDLGHRINVYISCDADCSKLGSWAFHGLIESERLGAGIDLALDERDRPRMVFTSDSNIFLAHCEDQSCTAQDAKWTPVKVELGSDMDPDEVIPYTNCTVAAWFLRHPSIALAKDGTPRVVYRAEDISGGTTNPDPTKPRCQAGVDMTLSRLARVPAL